MPALVHRVRRLKQEMLSHGGFSEGDVHMWHTLGIDESIDLPEHREAQ